ncbi:MAG: hypothetical protein ABS36_11790 [Acidobacteria bacterium SCN 69-37]|nr:MAG: hypothetical protein ABS36_11790 [Acidobacteria bacterium SCN 69-37]
MAANGSEEDTTAAAKISQRIVDLGDWRGEMLGRIRAIVTAADPGIVEEWKWEKPTSPGTPCWSRDGLICTGETHRNVVKTTFAKGASLADPGRLFNASLEGRVRRAIDFHEGDVIDARALTALVREAVALNVATRKAAPGRRARR